MSSEIQHVYVVNPPGSGGGGVTSDVNLIEVDGVAVSLGQKPMATSFPVVIASDQSPFSTAPIRGAITNRSGTITVGGASQVLAAANATRNYLFIQNISTDVLWVDFGVAAVQDQPAVKLCPESVFVMEGGFVSTDSINIIGPTTGAKFVAKEG